MDKKRLVIYPVLFLITFLIAARGFRISFTDSLLIPYLVTLGFFTILFFIAQTIKDNSIVDMFWGSGFVIGSITTLLVTPSPTLLSYVITAFIFIWGARLSYRIIKRNWGKPEDFRYQNWRKEWGKNAVVLAFFRVFMIQGLINFTVGSASYIAIRYNQFSFDKPVVLVIVLIGLLISFTGLFFEVIGDEQLRRHIKKGERKLMKTGLWSITRHPNYFGEILIWSGLYIVGLATASVIGYVYYGLLIISPLIMSAVLIKISTPLLEKHMSKYDGWEAYTKETPMIFPWKKK